MKLLKHMALLLIVLHFNAVQLMAQTSPYYLKAMELIQDKDYASAILQLDACISNEPNLAMAYFQRGTCQLLNQKPNVALVDLNQALKLDSNITEAYLNRGIAHHSLHNYTFAEADLLIYLRRQSTDLKAYYNLAVLYEDMDDYKQAIKFYTRYLNLSPDLNIRQLRAMAYANIDSIGLAIKDLDICLQPNANDTSLWMCKGNVYYDANMNREAIDAYNVILLLYPKHTEALYNRADAYCNLGQFDKALFDYQTLSANDLKEADYYFNIAFCQIQLKDNQNAILNLNKAIEYEFHDFGLLLTLRGIAYINMNLKDEACSDWKHALQIGYKEAEKYVNEVCLSGK
jgi:tetratricopeptide (TPR) repeat protein